MSITTSEMSPADFAACCGGNNRSGDGMWGDGNGLIWLIVLFLFGWGRNGFGGGFGGNQGGGYPMPYGCGGSSCATQADLAIHATPFRTPQEISSTTRMLTAEQFLTS